MQQFCTFFNISKKSKIPTHSSFLLSFWCPHFMSSKKFKVYHISKSLKPTHLHTFGLIHTIHVNMIHNDIIIRISTVWITGHLLCQARPCQAPDTGTGWAATGVTTAAWACTTIHTTTTTITMTTTAPTTTTTTAETGIIHVILWDTVTTLTCLGRHVSGTRVGTEACPSVVQEMPRPPARGRGTVGAWQNLTPPITIQVVPSVSQLQSLEYLSLR